MKRLLPVTAMLGGNECFPCCAAAARRGRPGSTYSMLRKILLDVCVARKKARRLFRLLSTSHSMTGVNIFIYHRSASSFACEPSGKNTSSHWEMTPLFPETWLSKHMGKLPAVIATC